MSNRWWITDGDELSLDPVTGLLKPRRMEITRWNLFRADMPGAAALYIGSIMGLLAAGILIRWWL